MPEGNIAAEQHRKRERKVVHGEHRTPDYVERQGKPGERAITKRPHQQAIKSSKDFQGSEGREKLDELRVGEAVAVETDEGLLVVSEVLDRKFDQLDISEHEAKKLLKCGGRGGWMTRTMIQMTPIGKKNLVIGWMTWLAKQRRRILAE